MRYCKYFCISSIVSSSLSTQTGAALLLQCLAGSLASTVLVTTYLEVLPQHRLFMKGCNGCNVKHITQTTGAQIYFPDPNSPQDKSTVQIQGNIQSACLAWQYLMVSIACMCVLFINIRLLKRIALNSLGSAMALAKYSLHMQIPHVWYLSCCCNSKICYKV